MAEPVDMDSPSSRTCWSEESDCTDPLVQKFGEDPIVAVVRHPDLVQEMVQAGRNVTANAVLAASYTASAASLISLLSAVPEIGPDARLEIVDKDFGKLAPGWFDGDITPNIGIDKRQWYPLHFAAASSDESSTTDKEDRNALIRGLLAFQPDLYATFIQPIWQTEPCPYPGQNYGEDAPVESEDDAEDRDLEQHGMIDGEWQRYPTPECGYGLRSVIHALFEDGAYLEPFLEQGAMSIDLERRDPQGRTLIHCVCRNAVGADAKIDARIQDTRGPQWPKLVASGSSEQSLFHAIRERGADMLAVDYTGKNILHHLLEARSSPEDDARPPLIRKTLNYILEALPSLINQPDNHDNPALCMALQRMRHYTVASELTKASPVAAIVQDLLAAGADPMIVDSRGNTAFHYLASCGLAEQLESEDLRALCRHFCTAGLNVNHRNMDGLTALELLMDDSGETYDRLWSRNFNYQGQPPSLRDVDREVCDMFHNAGAKWDEFDARGRTLLHIVAVHPTEKAKFRAEYLLGKKIDPGTKDKQGRTVADVARQYNNVDVLDVLEQRSRRP